MTVAYQARIYDTSGNLQAVVDRFRNFTIEHRVNHPSTLTFAIYELADAVQYFTLDSLIEIRRRVADADLDWYTEFIGFHRTSQRQITAGNQRIFTAYCRGLLDLVQRRSVRYYADTDGSAKGPAAADDVIKAYVRENAGSSATIANGRLTDGQTTGLSIAADSSQAATYEGANAWRNLLDTIREIGESFSVDFDVEWGGTSAPTTFTFRTYYPRLGTDRSVTSGAVPFTFAPDLGNMSNPSYTQSRTSEITSVLVLGPGESVDRDTTLRTNATAIAESPWNLVEVDHDARNEDREAALNAIGDGVLDERRAAVSFSFEPIQTPESTYSKHYFLGDLVTGRFSSVQADVKIRAVTLNVQGNTENISLELEEPPS